MQRGKKISATNPLSPKNNHNEHKESIMKTAKPVALQKIKFETIRVRILNTHIRTLEGMIAAHNKANKEQINISDVINSLVMKHCEENQIANNS